MSNHEEPGDLSAAEGVAILLALAAAVVVIGGILLWLCAVGIIPAYLALLLGGALGYVTAVARR